jgi:rhodanese-related sulfurtransferase
MKLNKSITTRVILAVLILLGLLVPLGLYRMAFGRAAMVMPADARVWLADEEQSAALVDVRSAEIYRRKHIDGSEHWAINDILAIDSPEQLPAALRGRKLLLICDMGPTTVTAAEHLSDIGVADVYWVRGGLQAWIGAVGPGAGEYETWRTGDGRIEALPFHDATASEQFLAIVSGYGFKITYSLLSLALVIVLWRSRAADLTALRWALIFFFIGENCCAVNYVLFGENSYLFEFLHGYGMLLCFAFTTYAIIEGFDHRIIRLSGVDETCAAQRLCGRCIKHTDAPCGLRRVFYLLIAAMMVVAGMLLTADVHEVSYNVEIYGSLYNYSNPIAYQLYELVFCPAAALVMFGASLVLLLTARDNRLGPAKMAFASGFGALGFGSLRMILAGAYSQRMVYFVFWEEATELLFILGVCCVLWIFRHRLLTGGNGTTLNSPQETPKSQV